MRTFFLAILLLTSSHALATFKSIARQHLAAHNIPTKNLELDQETKSSLLYLSLFAAGDTNHPCHVGVVVDKKTGLVTLGEQDPFLVLEFPYSDTFPDPSKKLILFCAD